MELSNASAPIYRVGVASAVARAGYSKRIRAFAYTPSHPRRLQVTLAGDVFEKYWLVQPVVINLEEAEGKIIASDDVFYMYGEGDTQQDAVRDYLSSLSEYYTLLESYDDTEGSELFSYLQTYLRPKIAT